MAKKVKKVVRAKKRKSVSAKAIASKQLKQVKPVKKGQAPLVLNMIASIWLLVNGLLLIIGKTWFARLMSIYSGQTVDAASLLSWGIIWLILGILVWASTLRVESKNNKVEKWYLFALGVITLLTGRLESGILIIIGSAIYLKRK